MNTCYVYKWTHIPTLKWYVGSRTAKNSHPQDGYICSSRYVRPLIKSKPQEWIREIIAIGGADEMYELETEILQLTDAKNDPRSFNSHNNDGLPRNKHLTGKPSNSKGSKWSEENKQQRSQQYRGKGNPNYGKTASEETKAKIGAKSGPQRGAAISAALTGKPNSNRGKKIPSLSKSVTGRKMAIREDGSRYWIYPKKENI